jgi:hypothetical protein
MAKDWRVVIDDTGGPQSGWPSVSSDEEDRTVLHTHGFKQDYWQGATLTEAMEIAKLVAAYMNGPRRKGKVGSTRNLQRLDRLANSAAEKTGAERALIVRTLLKILDECSDAEYDSAMADKRLTEKLAAVGIIFDDDDSSETDA